MTAVEKLQPDAGQVRSVEGLVRVLQVVDALRGR